jgi:hypothetical protein
VTPAPAFIDEVRTALSELDLDGEKYWSSCLEGTGIEHVDTIPLSKHRWYMTQLDVYRRKADGALAGVRWDSPATEVQEDQDRNAVAVLVETYTTTSYRVVKS